MKTEMQKGFTLVELAIVMTIIGLLIGGILKGQELMQNARVTSTIAQVRAYEAATTTFRDKYDAIPGDMSNATTRIPGCTVSTNCNPGATNAGDGIVGLVTYASGGWLTQTTAAATALPIGAGVVGYETHLYWTHLLLADLISGVTNAAVATAATPVPAWGETHPAAKIGGGFVVGYGNGQVPPNSTAAPAASAGPSGMILVLVQAPTIGSVATMTTGGAQPLTPTRAAQIDRKMDDGRAEGGFVQGYGVAASCFDAASNNSYKESVTSNDCGLVFRIQG